MGTTAPVPGQSADSQPSSSPLSLADDSLAEPSIVDQRRFWANHAGQSVAEIAQSSGATEEEVTRSILCVRNDNSRYSATAAGVEARKIFIHALPRISSALDEALVATRFDSRKVIMVDKETGKTVSLEETVERPDHDTRLQAIDRARSVFSVVQPRDPAVQIVSNSQTNILNQGGPQPGGGHGPGALTSPEAVIRSIVAQRALALTDGKAAPPAARPTILEGEPVPSERNEEHEPEDIEREEDAEDEEIDDDDGGDEDDDEEDAEEDE